MFFSETKAIKDNFFNEKLSLKRAIASYSARSQNSPTVQTTSGRKRQMHIKIKGCVTLETLVQSYSCNQK